MPLITLANYFRGHKLHEMKKIVTIGVIVVAIAALVIFNSLTSKKGDVAVFTEVNRGQFEITVTNSGELLAEHSIDILGPSLATNDQGGRGGGGRGGFGGMGNIDMHAQDLKILDIVAEGTMVKAGDYIAQLDRTSYDNSLKDAQESVTTYKANVDLAVLDTAVTLTSLRDNIKNQHYVVEEAAIALDQSRFEPPAVIKKAENTLNKEQRALDQLKSSYKLRVTQNLANINQEKLKLERTEKLVSDLQNFLSQFTVRAPADGMVTYYKDRIGSKRKAGSSVNTFDRVIATLPDLSSMLSKVYVNEIEISKVKLGQKAEITIDAFPNKSFTGEVISVANIGEQLPNSDAKMFEVMVKLDGSDQALRPSMTTTNKIIIKSFPEVTYIPLESVHTGADSIPFVYKRNRTRQIVILGEANDKNIIVEKGLEPGTSIYLYRPENAENFSLTGEDMIPVIREREREKRLVNQAYASIED